VRPDYSTFIPSCLNRGNQDGLLKGKALHGLHPRQGIQNEKRVQGEFQCESFQSLFLVCNLDAIHYSRITHGQCLEEICCGIKQSSRTLSTLSVPPIAVCYTSFTYLSFQCSASGRTAVFAKFYPATELREPGQAQLFTSLLMYPEGHEAFDDILMSALIIERLRTGGTLS
jgi:hypothetical protein